MRILKWFDNKKKHSNFIIVIFPQQQLAKSRKINKAEEKRDDLVKAKRFYSCSVRKVLFRHPEAQQHQQRVRPIAKKLDKEANKAKSYLFVWL
jgi:hypothetical protein